MITRYREYDDRALCNAPSPAACLGATSFSDVVVCLPQHLLDALRLLAEHQGPPLARQIELVPIAAICALEELRLVRWYIEERGIDAKGVRMYETYVGITTSGEEQLAAAP